MRLKAYRLHFHPVNDLFLITGGLHLLRGISLYCRCFTHDRWDCYGHRALLPIREDSLLKFFNLFPLLAFLCARSSSSVGCICSTEFTLRGLSFVNQQVPWLHMLYAAIGAIVYTLVSLLTWIRGVHSSLVLQGCWITMCIKILTSRNTQQLFTRPNNTLTISQFWSFKIHQLWCWCKPPLRPWSCSVIYW